MPKKAALRPAQAAARGGLSSAEVSKGTEGLILNVLSSRDASARAGLEETNVKKLGKTWDELKSLGFDDDVITEVLQSCATISKEAALDWLCLNVDEQRLPRQFRSAYRPSEAAKGEVVVVKPAGRSNTAAGASKEPGVSKLEQEARLEAEREENRRRAAEAAEAARRQREEEAAAQRAWILQAAMQSSESDDEGSGEEEEEKEEPEDLGDQLNGAEAALEVAKLRAGKAKYNGTADAMQAPLEELASSSAALQVLCNKLTASAAGGIGRASNSATGKKLQAQARKDLVRCNRLLANARGEVKSMQLAREEALAKSAAASASAQTKEADSEDELPSLNDLFVAESETSAERQGAGSSSCCTAHTEVGSNQMGSGKAREDDGGRGRRKGGGKELGKERIQQDEEEGGGAEAGKEDTGNVATGFEGSSVADALAGWKGKTPKIMLIEWCKKNKLPPPKFTTVRTNPAACTVAIGKRLYVDESGVAPPKVQEAEHLAATAALHNLAEGRQLHRILPPLFRDIWLWLDARIETEKTEAQRAEESTRQATLEAVMRARRPGAKSQVDKSRKVQQTTCVESLAVSQAGGEGQPVAEAETPATWEELTGNAEAANAGSVEDRARSSDDVAESWEELVEGNGASVAQASAEADGAERDATEACACSDGQQGIEEPMDRGAQRCESARMQSDFEALQHRAEYRRMEEARLRLPIAAFGAELQRTIRENAVTIVVGETGCGKTTQVPQMVLDDMLLAGRGAECQIVCTQPRRVAAVGVAERVSAERCERPGAPGALAAHQIRMESTRTASTRLLFCTTGVLLRRLQDDPELTGLSHVIVDEAHERDILCDFLLILLREALARRRPSNGGKGQGDLRVVIMSATINAARFSDYFFGAAVIEVPGFTHPVEDWFLEDVLEKTQHRIIEGSPCALRPDGQSGGGFARIAVSGRGGTTRTVTAEWGAGGSEEACGVNPLYREGLYEQYSQTTRKSLRRVDESAINYELIEDLLLYIEALEPDRRAAAAALGAPGPEHKGGVLIFLPGIGEITSLADRLTSAHAFTRQHRLNVVAAHSSLSTADQRRIFRAAPRGVRKVVLATNIAETSITIEDVEYVIDAGRCKETAYDERTRLRRLEEQWIDCASMRQRRGRAGRVRPGVCFHLYTRQRAEHHFDRHKRPEMQRAPLEDLCLQVKVMGNADVAAFLAQALDPPSAKAVEAALLTLLEVGALALPDADASLGALSSGAPSKEGGTVPGASAGLYASAVLTPLGHHLSRLPVDPHVGKMLIYGCILGCLDPILTVAATCAYKSPFAAAFGARAAVDAARAKLAGPAPRSDLLLAVAAFKTWEEAHSERGGAEKVCREFSLNEATLRQLRDLRRQFTELLVTMGFVPRNSVQQAGAAAAPSRTKVAGVRGWWDAHSRSEEVVCAVVCAGLYPNLVQAEGQPGHVSWFNAKERGIAVHPSSVLRDRRDLAPGALLSYHLKVATTRTYLMDATEVSANAAMLFGGAIRIDHAAGRVTLDGWLSLAVPARTAVLIRELRKELQALLSSKIDNPRGELGMTGAPLVKAAVALLRDYEKGDGR